MHISITGLEARNKIIKGAKYLSSSVGATLGPFGSNALLENGNYPTNDGYTISAALANTVKDEFERRGAIALHEASAKTNDEVGDATTTAEVLAQAIMDEAIRLLPNDKTLVAKKKPSEILEMIEKSKDNVIKELKYLSLEVKTEKDLIASAKVSVDDASLASIIGSAQWEIGKDGYIVAEETNEPTSSVQIVKGIRIDNGFGTPFVITNQATQSLEMKDSSIILTNYIFHKQDLLNLRPIIDELVRQKKTQLIIIARAFDSEVIQLCMQSMQTGFLIAPLNAPYVYQSEIMEDIAAITGATYYDTEKRNLEDLNIKDVGFCTKLAARRFDAIITGVEPSPLINASVQGRISQLEAKLNGTAVSDFERKGLQARIAQFTGGFAILKVGAETTFERKYKFDKAQDAVNSVRLALQGGTVKGAGLAFKEISDTLEETDILKRPLLSIYNQIMTSAPEGYVIPEWIRDPMLTLTSALKNACSVAGQFCNIGAVITTQNPKVCNCNKQENE